MVKNKDTNCSCANCGSSNIVFDATAEWCFKKQAYVVNDIMDKGHHCVNCDTQTNVNWS